MKYRPLKKWKKVDELRGLLFFVQRLEELTFSYSLDSYKAPTTSIFGLASEAIDILSEASHFKADSQNKAINAADHIVKELRYRLSGNKIARSYISIDVDRLLTLDKEKNTIKDYIDALKTFRAEADEEQYISEIIKQVISLSSKGNKKKDLDLLAREFASTLQARGMSREHIYESVIDFFYRGEEISSPECLKKFGQIVYPHNHRFLVVIEESDTLRGIPPVPLKRHQIYRISEEDAKFLHNPEDALEDREKKRIDTEESESDTDEFEVEISDNEGDADNPVNDYQTTKLTVSDLSQLMHPFSVVKEEKLQEFANTSTAKSSVFVNVMAPDYKSAVANAIERVDDISSFFRLFSHKSENNQPLRALAIQSCCEQSCKEVNTIQNPMHYIRDMRPKAASEKLKRIDNRISIDSAEDANKLKNIIKIHGMSLSSGSADIQIVNIWTCLETMATKDSNATNIANVTNSIIPAIMLGYYKRLVSGLISDILRWDSKILSNSFNSADINETDTLTKKFIALITEEKNNGAFGELLSGFKDFELLRHRTFTLSQVLKDPQEIKKKLANHEQLVNWQIHRIYRTRNKIVHSGESPKFTKYLLENAHDFFDIALFFCLELSAWKRGYSTFNSCLNYGQTVYAEYSERIKTGDPVDAIWTLPKRTDRSFIFDAVRE
ncbi:hypothetical protein [Arenibacterium sp. LLYu02]|uniref:hypothetical protein n=1 Tax=Arenibacterium sp. LLYu02 TaxID=3404132 RepID=UPI003B20F13C